MEDGREVSVVVERRVRLRERGRERAAQVTGCGLVEPRPRRVRWAASAARSTGGPSVATMGAL